jgi:hypothetical protein
MGDPTRRIVPTAAGPMCSECGRGVGVWLAPDESPCRCNTSERDTRDLCACSCGCETRLDEGNRMQQDVTDDPDKPWEKADPDGCRVMLIICAECYIGAHAPRSGSR